MCDKTELNNNETCNSSAYIVFHTVVRN